MNPRYFGCPDRQLFGIHHPPRGRASHPVRAVVICPPIGQEYIRTHWCLRLLAGQLARKGMHVFRFDYFGIGDSLGNADQNQSLGQWQRDVGTATHELQSIAGCDSVMLVGLRTGAMFAANYAMQSPNVHSLVLWEPVSSAGRFVASLRSMHKRMLDLWVCPMETEDSETGEEILGTRYSRRLLRDIEHEHLDWETLNQPHLVVRAGSATDPIPPGNPMRKIVTTEDEESWSDLRQLETAWLRPQSARMVVDGASEIFDRLIRLGLLQSPMSQTV